MAGSVIVETKEKIVYISYIILGVLFLLICRHYAGPMKDFVHSYGAGLSVSFGGYFIFKFFRLPPKASRSMNAVYVLLVTSASEIAQGLGWYRGTFDYKDFIAYAIGSSLALAVDLLSALRI